jgi:hypothetical protein
MKYPKAMQRELALRWSFNGLVSELAKIGALRGARGLLYDYALGSHIVHQDGDAVLTMMDRERRSPARMASIELAHAAKLLSTVLAYARLRAISAFRAKDVDPEPIRAVDENLKPLEAEFAAAHEAWTGVEYGASLVDQRGPG